MILLFFFFQFINSYIWLLSLLSPSSHFATFNLLLLFGFFELPDYPCPLHFNPSRESHLTPSIQQPP